MGDVEGSRSKHRYVVSRSMLIFTSTLPACLGVIITLRCGAGAGEAQRASSSELGSSNRCLLTGREGVAAVALGFTLGFCVDHGNVLVILCRV